ncbi:immune inhibitor A [candidate division KSB1 bacterium]|nr:immune inhibitor A [candidate division KSB1 bacterium]
MKRLLSALIIVTALASGGVFAQTDEPQLPKGTLAPAPGCVALLDNARTTLLQYDFEAEIPGLQITAGWQVNAAREGGGHFAFAGTDVGYANDSFERLVLPLLSIPALGPEISGIRLTFQEWFELESEYDYGAVSVSADDGASWIELDRRSGQSDWRENTIDLTRFAGQSILVAFDLVTDSSITFTGWQLDDIGLATASRTALDVNIVSLSSQNFPFVYLNVNVSRDGQPVLGLIADNFFVTENGTQQTDNFNVTPPSEGGQVRLVDIVFCMDNSGSLAGEQNAVRNNVINFVNALTAQGAAAAFGLVRFGQTAGSGQPIVEEGGILTEDATYFRDVVWSRNVASGGTEPGLDAMWAASTAFSYRPGAQRIVILITDEDNDPSNHNQAQVISQFQATTTTAFCLIDHAFGNAHNDYCPVSSATNGACLNVTDPFGPILDYIGNAVTATYVVSYRSSQPNPDGVERHVVTQVTDAEGSGSDDAYYMPGSAPQIQRTAETVALHDQAWAEGTTFNIEANITDASAPFVTSARVYYRTTGGATYSSVVMSSIGGNIWRGVVPASAVHTPGLSYYITATDGQQTASDPSVDPALFPYTIGILPNAAPILTHVPISEFVCGQVIQVTCFASDVTNNLQSVALRYRRVGELIYQSTIDNSNVNGQRTLTIPASYASGQGIQYYLVATDNFGVSTTRGTQSVPYQMNASAPAFSNATEDEYWYGHDFEVRITTPEPATIQEATVKYFRFLWIWDEVELSLQGSEFVGTIPGNHTDTEELRYYFEVTDQCDAVHSIGSESDPIRPRPVWKLENSVRLFDRGLDAWSFCNCGWAVWPRNMWQNGDPVDEQACCEGGTACTPNFRLAFPSWAMFEEAFTRDEVLYQDRRSGQWLRRERAIRRWNDMKGCWGGSCLGFSLSSMLFFGGYESVPSRFGDNQTVRSIGFSDDDFDAAVNLNHVYQLYQYGDPLQSDCQDPHSGWFRDSPNETLAKLKRQLASDTQDEGFIVFWGTLPDGNDADTDRDDLAHAVVPLRLHKVSDSEYRVYVYNNWNPDDEPYFTFSTNGIGSWTYSDTNVQPPSGTQNGSIIVTDGVSEYSGHPDLVRPLRGVQPIEDEITADVFYSQPAQIEFEDENNNVFGFNGERVYGDLDAAVPFLPITGMPSKPIGFTVMLMSHRIEYSPQAGSMGAVNMWLNSNEFIRYLRSDYVPGESEDLLIDPAERTMDLLNEQPSTKIVSADLVGTPDETREFLIQLRNLRLDPNSVVRLALIGDGADVVAEDGSLSTDAEILTIRDSISMGKFALTGMNLPPTTRVRMLPNWDSLATPMPILIDLGNDGIIDDTMYVRNELGRDICNEDPEVSYTASALLQPQLVAKVHGGQLRLFWNAIPAASYYQIYRGDQFDSLSPIAMTYDTTWTDTTIAAADASRKAFYQIVAQRTESFQVNNNDEELLASWLFEEGAGEVSVDETGHGHDATLHNADWYEYGVDSQMCWGLGFANNEWADVANDNMFYMAPLQIDAHLKVDQLPAGSPSYILGNTRYAPLNGGFAWRIEPSGLLTALAWNGNGWNELHSVVPVMLNEWFTATLIMNGDESMMLVNGTVVAAGRLLLNSANNEMPLTIGASALPSGNHQYFLRGQIGWMKMRELTLP